MQSQDVDEALAGGAGRNTRESRPGDPGAKVEDATSSGHERHDTLSDEEQAAHVLVDELLELLGAGLRQACLRGHTCVVDQDVNLRLVLITLGSAAALAVWSAYAFSTAGHIWPLPLTRAALAAISTGILIRASGFPMLKRTFPENLSAYWWVLSGICLAVGALYAWGAALMGTSL